MMRTVNIVVGSKAFFQEQIKDISDTISFLDLIKLSDAYHGKHEVFPDELKAESMILRMIITMVLQNKQMID